MSPFSQRTHVSLPVRCTHCQTPVLLECEGVPTYLGYQTYNEYVCPHCRKQNIQRTPGAIVAARAIEAVVSN